MIKSTREIITFRKKTRVMTRRNIKDFCYRFIGQIQQTIRTLNAMNVETKEKFPQIFQMDNISYECVYSIDRKHVLIIFKSDTKSSFEFNLVNGNIFNYLNKTGMWENSGTAFKLTNCSQINIKQCKIHGMKPFEIEGDNVELIIDNLELDVPQKGTIILEFALVMSYGVLIERLNTLTNYVNDIVHGYVEYWQLYGKKYDSTEVEAFEYKKKLLEIKSNMEKYFFDETISEHTIDQFLQANPLVLRICLNLVNLMHQSVLKDLEGKYGQDLKPDLIGFNISEKQWTIVDYKRAKRSIIKNLGKVRTTFKAEVAELEAQLSDYREYFEESKHRNYVKENYSVNIEFPIAVGIIGNVTKNEERDFNRQKQNVPNWFKILPYNYLYDDFCRYIAIVDKLQ